MTVHDCTMDVVSNKLSDILKLAVCLYLPCTFKSLMWSAKLNLVSKPGFGLFWTFVEPGATAPPMAARKIHIMVYRNNAGCILSSPESNLMKPIIDSHDRHTVRVIKKVYHTWNSASDLISFSFMPLGKKLKVDRLSTPCPILVQITKGQSWGFFFVWSKVFSICDIWYSDRSQHQTNTKKNPFRIINAAAEVPEGECVCVCL